MHLAAVSTLNLSEKVEVVMSKGPADLRNMVPGRAQEQDYQKGILCE